MKNLFITFFFLFSASLNASEIYARTLLNINDSELVWEEKCSVPFDEMIVSWSSSRPEKGNILIQLSVRLPETEWSDWYDYAFWGYSEQHSYKHNAANLKVFQDALEILNGKKAIGFRIRVIAQEGAKLNGFRTLYACLTDLKSHTVKVGERKDAQPLLPVQGLSQMALKDDLSKRICSATSTTAVLRYLKPERYNPVDFANKVYDTAFDIYGNWVLNTAQAASMLDWPWHCFVCRLTSFDDIIASLEKGQPVVLSIRGPLNGSALPYESGHLVVVRGYDSINRKVHCMDPAFPTDDQTLVQYDLEDFVAAWKRRNGVAYLFCKEETP